MNRPDEVLERIRIALNSEKISKENADDLLFALHRKVIELAPSKGQVSYREIADAFDAAISEVCGDPNQASLPLKKVHPDDDVCTTCGIGYRLCGRCDHCDTIWPAAPSPN